MEKRLESPITGGIMTLEWEERKMTFRKESYKVMFPFYKCHDTGEQFTTTESDGVWLAQLRNQYCQKYGIPYTDEIVRIREKYGLSAAMMSEILGFGANQWRKYEQEEIPNVSNGRMIRSIMNPKVMLDILNNAKPSLREKDYVRISKKIESTIRNSDKDRQSEYDTSRIFSTYRGIENGYAPLSLERLKNILLYVISKCGETWYTKMNKILFYIDFTSYRDLGMAISGLQYRAIDYGPVPEHFARVKQTDTMKRKQFVKGIEQIALEGAIQIFHDLHTGLEEIVVGAVGELQFEVLTYRLKNEYNVDVSLEVLPYEYIRWIENPEEHKPSEISGTSDMKIISDMKDRPLLLFAHEWSINMVLERNKGLKLMEFSKN